MGGLLTRMYFLPYAYHVVVFCLSLLFILLFVFLFLVYLFLFCASSVSLPGVDVLCWLLSCPFSSVCFPIFLSRNVPGLVWFVTGSVGHMKLQPRLMIEPSRARVPDKSIAQSTLAV